MEAIIAGIDVSKGRLDVALRPGGEVFVVERSAGGLDILIGRLRALAPHIVALEATGGFETVVTAALAAAGLPVVVVNPAQVRSFAKAIGQRARTDPIDAGVIAHFAEATKPEVRPLPDAATQLLADLVQRRRQIIEMISAESQRHKRAPAALRASIARLMQALQKELTSVDGDIDAMVRSSPAWRETETLLTSVPSIGKTIASTLVASLPELGQCCPGTIDRPGQNCMLHDLLSLSSLRAVHIFGHEVKRNGRRDARRELAAPRGDDPAQFTGSDECIYSGIADRD